MVAPRPARFGDAARARSSCSTTRRTTATRTSSLETTDDRRRDARTRSATREARVWFRGPRAICAEGRHQGDLRPLGDAVLPEGSGYKEGFIFPWVVSDFSLMDAIESGIVKVPRVPVDDDAAAEQLDLPATLGPHRAAAAEARRRRRRRPHADWVPPQELEGALRSLYRSYERRFARTGDASSRALGEPPPVIIVVCPNTIVSKLVFDWIAGREIELAGRDRRRSCPATLPLLQQRRGRRVDARASARSSSTRRSSSPASRSSADFKKDAAQEIEEFKQRVPRAGTPAPTSTSSPTTTCCAR